MHQVEEEEPLRMRVLHHEHLTSLPDDHHLLNLCFYLSLSPVSSLPRTYHIAFPQYRFSF